MNNILDYSHMLKTYIMITNFDELENIDNSKCICDKSIECFQINELNNCNYYDLIIETLPLFKILINPNIETKFSLPKKFETSNIDLLKFTKILLYIIKFKDESVDYMLNKKYIKCVVLLNMYILIITNYNIIKSIMYLFEPFIIKLKNDLNNYYLNNQDNINKLNILFKKYFKESPVDCINIMKSWEDLLNKLINE
jgi:hypothetical protein